MPYLSTKLITNAYFLSGVVARDFQTVTSAQVGDGLDVLNEILGDKTVENNMIPYYSKYDFNLVPGQEPYFIPNLIEADTFTFFVGSPGSPNAVRYPVRREFRKNYFGNARANNINSFPFNWHLETTVGGATIYLYFQPEQAFAAEIWGQFRLNSVNLNQDLSSPVTTVNLGAVTVGGTGAFAGGELVINNVDLAGTYATAQALATQINTLVPGVKAAISLGNFILTGSTQSNITIQTLGSMGATNFVTFFNFSTQNGPLDQIFYPLQLDQFYINYLKYALARRLCMEFAFEVPARVEEQYQSYVEWITNQSSPMDLHLRKISSLGDDLILNYGQVNLGKAWTT